MSDADFGFSKVNWEEMNLKNVQLVEAEYKLRFQGTLKGQQEIDKKAQFVLSGLVGLITAVLGLTLSQAKNIEVQDLAALYALVAMLGLGAIFASMSVYPRTYAHLGATPADLDVSLWEPLLKGYEKDTARLCGVRIKEYARAITMHAPANAKKSRWLKAAILATVLSFPVAVSVAIAPSAAVFLNVAKAAVVTPMGAAVCVSKAAIVAPIGIVIAALLLLGAAALLGRRIFSVGHGQPPYKTN